MRNIHIALVGGQPVPVYIGIYEDVDASIIVLICSNQSKNEAQRIADQFPGKDVRIEMCSSVDLMEIDRLSSKLSKEFRHDSIRVNLSSGTKLWAIEFFRNFHANPNTEFIYVDQNNLITNIQTHKTFQSEISNNKIIDLHGSPLISYVPIEEYTEADYDVLRLVEVIRNFNPSEFTSMTMDVKEKDIYEGKKLLPKKNGQIITTSSYIDCYPETNYAFVYICRGRRFQTFDLCSEHLFSILLHTGWFELKVAKLLSEFTDVSNIWLNCIFEYNDGDSKNEIDNIAKYKNRMFFVECKTSITKKTDIDKFRSAVRNYGGTSNIGLVVTYDPPRTNDQKIKYNQIIQKCKDNNLHLFNYGLHIVDPVNYPSLEEILKNIAQTQNIR